MTNRENKYCDSLHSNFTDLLDKFVRSDVIQRKDKLLILNDMKNMIDERIRALQYEDFIE